MVTLEIIITIEEIILEDLKETLNLILIGQSLILTSQIMKIFKGKFQVEIIIMHQSL